MIIEFLVTILRFLQSFSLELCCAGLMFCWHLPKRRFFALRLIPLITVVLLFSKQMSFIMPWRDYGSFSRYPPFQWGNYFNVAFLIVFCCAYVSLLLCFKADAAKVLLYCTSGYIVQNLGYQVMESFRYVAFGQESTVPYMLTALAVNIVCIGGAGAILIPIYSRESDVRLKVQFVAPFIVITFVLVTGFSKLITIEDRTNILSHLYAAACCLLLLYTQISFFFKARADLEKDKMEEILRKSSWKQEFFRQNTDIINRKCHDLKHEIAALRAIKSGEERGAYIDELARAVNLYDTAADTGNEVLDAILTEKSLICENEGIEFSCIADGRAVSFINSLDIYVILGNALDNAIEAEKKQPSDKRIITVQIKRHNNIALIVVENYISDRIEFYNGLPLTSKDDRQNHGFGTKSIKILVEKYGGRIIFLTSENRFIFKAIIPIPI